MKIAMWVLYCVLVTIGLVVFYVNASKVLQGCPEGQVLVKAIPTYECIRR